MIIILKANTEVRILGAQQTRKALKTSLGVHSFCICERLGFEGRCTALIIRFLIAYENMFLRRPENCILIREGIISVHTSEFLPHYVINKFSYNNIFNYIIFKIRSHQLCNTRPQYREKKTENFLTEFSIYFLSFNDQRKPGYLQIPKKTVGYTVQAAELMLR